MMRKPNLLGYTCGIHQRSDGAISCTIQQNTQKHTHVEEAICRNFEVERRIRGTKSGRNAKLSEKFCRVYNKKNKLEKGNDKPIRPKQPKQKRRRRR
jgi:hypothetical protein